MTIAGWIAAGDDIRIPQASDITIAMTITESVDGAAATPVNLDNFAEVTFTVQHHAGDHTLPPLELSTLDVSPRLTVTTPATGAIQIVLIPADFPTALTGTYRVNLLATGEAAGKPYGVGTFTVDAT